MTKKNAARTIASGQATSSQSFSIELGEHYHVKTTADQFDALLVGNEAGWLFFKRSKLLPGKILSHNSTIPVEEIMPEDFAVNAGSVVRIEPWQP